MILNLQKDFTRKESEESLMKSYHLTKSIKTSNIHLYNKNGTIKKYENIDEIIDEFYTFRLESCVERKKFIQDKMESELELLSYKVKFILAVIEKDIKINNKTKDKMKKTSSFRIP